VILGPYQIVTNKKNADGQLVPGETKEAMHVVTFQSRMCTRHGVELTTLSVRFKRVPGNWRDDEDDDALQFVPTPSVGVDESKSTVGA
jgi:hypothetical protein